MRTQGEPGHLTEFLHDMRPPGVRKVMGSNPIGTQIFSRSHTRVTLGTFRSEDEDDYEYEFTVLSMRIRFGSRHFSKCGCSEQKTRTRSRPGPPI